MPVAPRPTASLVVTLLVTALVALTGSRPAHANPKREARQHVERATQHHKAGEFAEALEELETAYKLDPKPDLLYAIGQVHVKLGQCTEAIRFYERFLATRPARGAASLARQAIQVCKTAPPPAIESKPEPAVESSRPAPEPEPDPPKKPEARPAPEPEPDPPAPADAPMVE